MHIRSVQLSEIGLSALKLKYRYLQMFQNNVKGDDIIILVANICYFSLKKDMEQIGMVLKFV